MKEHVQKNIQHWAAVATCWRVCNRIRQRGTKTGKYIPKYILEFFARQIFFKDPRNNLTWLQTSLKTCWRFVWPIIILTILYIHVLFPGFGRLTMKFHPQWWWLLSTRNHLSDFTFYFCVCRERGREMQKLKNRFRVLIVCENICTSIHLYAKYPTGVKVLRVSCVSSHSLPDDVTTLGLTNRVTITFTTARDDITNK